MFKIGIRIDGKWQYYLVEGEKTVEKTVSIALRTAGFDKISVGKTVQFIKIREDTCND